MRPKKPTIKPEEVAGYIANLRKTHAPDAKDYRTQALRLFPHICARCGTEFVGSRLKELTVHHRDNDHHNNPPDGSNWELLCTYCHEHEHQSHVQRVDTTGLSDSRPTLGHRAFEGLKDLLKPSDAPDSGTSLDNKD